MEVKVEDLSFNELIDLYKAVQEFVEFLETEEDTEVLEEKKEPKYTKTDINRMSTAELKELALANGVENAEEMAGTELKKCLISAFGL